MHLFWVRLTIFVLMSLNLTAHGYTYDSRDPRSSEYLEPQLIDPKLDTGFLSSIALARNLKNEPILNILFVAQDNRAPQERASRRTLRDNGDQGPALASRGDIIQVVSFNKATAQWTIFSFYRGMATPQACVAAGGGEEILADYYDAYGRRYTIPCLEYIVRTALGSSKRMESAYGAPWRSFAIHGFIEGTKEDTLMPLADDVLKVATGNKIRLLRAYGTQGLWRILSVIARKHELREALSGNSPGYKLTSDTNYLYVEAKEREIYAAAGYQRAFNFARLISDFLGWVGYGLSSDPALYQLFQPGFERNLSRSMSFGSLVDAMDLGGKSGIVAATYKNGYSPVRIIQFGPSTVQYSIFHQGRLEHFGAPSLLYKLRDDVQILPAPQDL